MANIKKLLVERNTQYADAWRKTGEITESLAGEIAVMHNAFPQAMIAWWTILCKLLRILGDPKHIDSWQDIAGYATLVVEYLEGETNEVLASRPRSY